MDPLITTGIAAVLLALIHLVAWRLQTLEESKQSMWLSLGAGISVAYVIVFLLPELNSFQEEIQDEEHAPLTEWLDQHVYIATLAGLLAFYGLGHTVRTYLKHGTGERASERTKHRIFWLHMLSYGVYNGLIGYLLLFQVDHGLSTLVFFTIALAIHFSVNDYAFREHHAKDYIRYGQWILSGSVLLGWGLGVLFELPNTAVALVLAFVFGGLIINLLKEELPREGRNKFWAFLLGATVYTIILLAI